MHQLEPGTVVEVQVTRVEEYGAWVSVDGVDDEGLILIPEISWGRVRRVSDHFQPGDRVRASVLAHDPESGRVSLGIKQLQPDPWVVHADYLVAGTVLAGRVVQVAEYGLFVEVFEHVEGLVHAGHLRHLVFRDPASEAKQVPDPVAVEVMSVRPSDRRLALAPAPPWSSAADVAWDRYLALLSVDDLALALALQRGFELALSMPDYEETGSAIHRLLEEEGLAQPTGVGTYPWAACTSQTAVLTSFVGVMVCLGPSSNGYDWRLLRDANGWIVIDSDLEATPPLRSPDPAAAYYYTPREAGRRLAVEFVGQPSA